MKFGIEKCAMLIIKKSKEKNGWNRTNKSGHQQTKMKEKVREKYFEEQEIVSDPNSAAEITSKT